MAQDLPQLDTSEYTVGWITALYHERVAADSMLDEKHAPLRPGQKHANDQNIYSLGSIKGSNGKHNVVVVSLPSNRYGTTPAATAAAQMLSSFPAIKFGLMVGIGGGIPSDENDIRLGDVVIGVDNTFGGVRQYGTGKFTTDDFEEQGALNSPPRVLLNAVSVLQGNHEMLGSNIPVLLNAMRENYPLMARPRQGPGYVYQGVAHDRLFEPDYVHSTPDKRDCSKCEREREVEREERPDLDPYVHYGTIASGNIVVKNAQMRDRLSDCLCFETEAAGLMNDFPCLVIRGICDYSDSHKNDRWQKYAAATAAAYAKELLMITDVVEVNSTPEARTVMTEHIVTELQDLKLTTSKIVSSLEEQHLNKRQQDILDWLSPLNPYARHFESQKLRVEGTGSWLLQDPDFLSWSSATPRFQKFCCYGDAGVGKTIISSLVIDELIKKAVTEEKVGLAYVYFDYQEDKQKYTVENIFGTIIKQLLQSPSEVQPAILDQCEVFKSQGGPLTSENAKNLFLATCARFNRVYICLDALDELELGNLRMLLKWICGGPPVQYFLTGRGFVQGTLQEYFKDAYNIIIEAHESDIRDFIEHEIGGVNDIAPTAMDEKLKTKIIAKVIKSAHGIFLLPAFQIRSILQEITKRDRVECLATLPSNLGEAFAGTMSRIQQQPNKMSELAQKVIAWVHLAERSLSMDTLLYSLAVKDGDNSFDPRGKPEPDILLRCCHGLIVVDKKTDAIRMVHYSLQEYLSSQNEMFGVSKLQWQSRVACTCLTFLQISPTDEIGESRTPFFPYAATEWVHHLRKGNEIQGPAFELAKTYLYTRRLHNSESLRLLTDGIKDNFQNTTNLSAFIAAIFGLEKITLYLSQIALDLDSTDCRGRTPLSYAAENGREAVAKILAIEKGAKVDSVDEYRQTPLFWAAANGHEPVVRLLLKNNAKVDSVNKYHETPLSRAAANGHITVVRLLFANGAKVESVNQYHEPPLFKAAQNRHYAIAKFLIENGARAESLNEDHQTPLFGAAASGSEAIARLLLENGANVNSLDKNGSTPLFRAAVKGREAIIKTLIANNATVNLMNKEGQTPLICATEHGRSAAAKILIENHAAVDLLYKDGQTLLMHSIKHGRQTMATTLIENHAKVDFMDKEGRTPLIYAAKYECEEVIRALFEHDATVDCMDKDGRTPLSWAATTGNESIVCLLLEKGAEVDSVDKEGRTPLSYAADKGREAVTKILIRSHAAVDFMDKQGRTPLSWAAQAWGSESQYIYVRLLTTPGDDLELESLAQFAHVAENGRKAVTNILIENGAALNLVDKDGRTLLSWAASKGWESVVRLLLEKGAEVNKTDRKGRTPLFWAVAGYPDDNLDCDRPMEKWKRYKLYEMNPRAGEKWVQAVQVSPQPNYDGIIKMLLERGAVVDVEVKEGKTMMSVIALAVPKDTLELLLMSRKNQGCDRKYTIKCLSESH